MGNRHTEYQSIRTTIRSTASASALTRRGDGILPFVRSGVVCSATNRGYTVS